jgi:serine/threonine-protein kinase
MLWEIIARRRIWGDLGDAAIITRLLADDIPRLRDVVPDIDPELDEICSKALAPNPARRYASASDMQRDLEAYLARSAVDVSQQAIGNLVDRSCRDLREQTRTTLQHKIRALGMSLTEDVDPAEVTESAEFVPAAPRQRRWLAGAVGPGIVVLVGLLALQRLLQPAEITAPGQTTAPARAPDPAPEPSSPPAGPSLPARVTVNMSVTPQEARLYLDDRLLASNPFRDTLPRDSLEHTFRARAEGFEEFRKVIRLESDLDITVSMKASRAAQDAQGVVTSRPRPKRQTPPARAPAPPRPVESAPPPAVTREAPPAPSEVRDTPPATLAPGQDLRATRGAPERRPVDFEDPYSKK